MQRPPGRWAENSASSAKAHELASDTGNPTRENEEDELGERGEAWAGMAGTALVHEVDFKPRPNELASTGCASEPKDLSPNINGCCLFATQKPPNLKALFEEPHFPGCGG